jgi:hypothetical protein
MSNTCTALGFSFFDDLRIADMIDALRTLQRTPKLHEFETCAIQSIICTCRLKVIIKVPLNASYNEQLYWYRYLLVSPAGAGWA